MPRKRPPPARIELSSSECSEADHDKLDNCCDCAENCKESPFEHRRFHDCSIIDKLFSNINMEILQKLCNRLQYTRSADSQENPHGITITIHLKKKPEKLSDGTGKSSNYTKVITSKSYSSDDSENEYVDANTLIPVPVPQMSDKKAYDPSDSDENEVELSKKLKTEKSKKYKKEHETETLCTKTYQHIVKRTWTEGFKCPYVGCEKSYSDFSELRKHEKVIHLQHRILCTWPGCKKLFFTAKAMRGHILTTHQGIKKYKCHYEGCDKSYRQKNGLEEHIRTHTGEKPWGCSGCKMRFHARKTYNDHVNKFCPVLNNRGGKSYRASNVKHTVVTELAKSPVVVNGSVVDQNLINSNWPML